MEEIVKLLDKKSKIGKLDFLSTLGLICFVACIPIFSVEELKDTFVPYDLLVIGALLMGGSNYVRERI